MEMPSWNNVKSKLSGTPPEQLMATIHELWDLSTQNKEYINAKFNAQKNAHVLAKYKERIRHPFFPKRGFGSLELRPAKSAIAEYYKATKDTAGKLELLLYYVECGTEFTNEYGDIDERFYNSLESALTQFTDICKDKPNLISPFVSRLQDLKKNTENIGWGYGDFVCDEASELVAMA